MEMSVKEEIEDHIIKQETSSVQKICRFCYNTFEKDIVKVEEKEREMMRILCLTLDLSMSENPLICSTCQRKLEECYNFKKVCIYTEECIAPYVVENVKVNWNEICGQIIDCEDGMDINLCRLCMQPTDNDMTVNNEDKEQFEQFFPEVNLNVTSFVVLCTKCYNSFQKLLVFISSCLEWEEKLHSYSEGGQVCLENFLHYLKYQTPSKDELVDMKAEERMLVKNERQEEADQKFALTNSELEIKDEDETDEMSLYVHGPNSDSIIYSVNHSIFDKQPAENSTAKPVFYCPYCKFKSLYKRNLRKHFKQNHIDPDKMKLYICGHCDRKFKEKQHLRKHIQYVHIDPAQTEKFKCQQCSFETRYEQHIKDHTRIMHGDPSTIVFYECQLCKFRTKYKKGLSKHVKTMHVDPSELEMHKCEHCGHPFKFKGNLRRHVLRCQGNSAEIYDVKTKCKGSLKAHMRVHTDPPKLFKCTECSFESTRSRYFTTHMKKIHSEIQAHRCHICGYESKYKFNIKRHTSVCTFLSQYIGIIQTESQSTMFQCKLCECLFNERRVCTKHIKVVHSKEYAEII